MQNITLFTSDGLPIGRAADLLPAAAMSSNGGGGVRKSSSSSSSGGSGSNGNAETDAALSANSCPPPPPPTTLEGTQLISLFRLFLQLHRPQSSAVAVGGAGGLTEAMAGSGGAAGWAEDDDDEDDDNFQHLVGDPGANLAGYGGAAPPPYAAFLEPSDRPGPAMLLAAHSGTSQQPQPLHGSGISPSALMNRNRSANGVDELPIRLGLSMGNLGAAHHHTRLALASSGDLDEAIREGNAAALDPAEEDQQQSPASASTAAGSVAPPQPTLSPAPLVLETSARQLTCAVRQFPAGAEGSYDNAMLHLGGGPLIFCCASAAPSSSTTTS